jgi:hypothetical protein
MSRKNSFKARSFVDKVSAPEHRLVGKSFAVGMLSGAASSTAAALAATYVSPFLVPIALAVPLYFGWRKTQEYVRDANKEITDIYHTHAKQRSSREVAEDKSNLTIARNIAFPSGIAFVLTAGVATNKIISFARGT